MHEGATAAFAHSIFLKCLDSLHALMICIKLITSALLQRAEIITAAPSSLRSSSTPAAPHSLHLKRLKHESGSPGPLCSSSAILSRPFPLTAPPSPFPVVRSNNILSEGGGALLLNLHSSARRKEGHENAQEDQNLFPFTCLKTRQCTPRCRISASSSYLCFRPRDSSPQNFKQEKKKLLKKLETPRVQMKAKGSM